MSKIITLNKMHSRMTVEQAINAAKENDFEDVLFIGWCNNELSVICSHLTRKDVLWLLKKTEMDVLKEE